MVMTGAYIRIYLHLLPILFLTHGAINCLNSGPRKTDQRLFEFGYLNLPEHNQILKDSSGRIFSNIVVSMNAKGHYVVNLNIDGIHHRRFIRPKMDLYETFQKNQFSESSAELKISILETLFPV